MRSSAPEWRRTRLNSNLEHLTSIYWSQGQNGSSRFESSGLKVFSSPPYSSRRLVGVLQIPIRALEVSSGALNSNLARSKSSRARRNAIRRARGDFRSVEIQFCAPGVARGALNPGFLLSFPPQEHREPGDQLRRDPLQHAPGTCWADVTLSPQAVAEVQGWARIDA